MMSVQGTGQSTGAATIFGVSGGVMEAALRFAYEAVSGQKLASVDLTAVRGNGGVREASVKIPGGPEVKVCVVSGLKNAKPVIDDVIKGKSPYHFIEVMTCPGGCVNGGGQPIDRSIMVTKWKGSERWSSYNCYPYINRNIRRLSGMRSP